MYGRRGSLSMWTVYDHPSDMPDAFVARMWLVGPEVRATGSVLTADTLEALRDKLPPGLACLPRRPDDDPAIVEVWL